MSIITTPPDSQSITVASEPGISYAKAPSTPTTLPWYIPSISKYLFRPAVSLFLTQYCKVPPAEQAAHIDKIRDQAWSIRSYPCTGLGLFLVPYIGSSPAHDEIVQRLKDDGSFLDFGCHLGSDMRQLVFDGAPSNHMVGVDIITHWEVGHELFRDRETFRGRFVEGDLLKASEVAELKELKGKVDVISVSAVMHQFDWETQLAAAKQIVAFSKIGTLLMGYQIGNKVGREVEQPMGNTVLKTWKQSPDTWEELWKEAAEGTGTIWAVEAQLREFEEVGWDTSEGFAWLPPSDKVLDWVVRRLA